MTFLAEFAEIKKNRNQSKTSAIFFVRHNINCSFFTMGGSSQIVHLNFFKPEATELQPISNQTIIFKINYLYCY